MASDDKAKATSSEWKFVAMLYDSKSREGRAAHDKLNKFRVKLANRTKSITRLSPFKDSFEHHNCTANKVLDVVTHCLPETTIPI